jgi:hypothetical protein
MRTRIKIWNPFDPGSGMEKIGSVILIEHPGSATLAVKKPESTQTPGSLKQEKISANFFHFKITRLPVKKPVLRSRKSKLRLRIQLLHEHMLYLLDKVFVFTF